ncbi:MAG TPA: hypothetical protein VF041_19560 [Gemmatimonadaceae bacterium]
MRSRADAPPLTSTRTSFWARRDAERVGTLYFQSVTGDPADSTELLRLTIPARALSRRPDGSRLAKHDSVRITITLVDPERLVVELEPSGLRFSSGHPARLELAYDHASGDLTGDGVVDGRDQVREAGLSIWRRETANDPWQRVSGSKHGGHKKIDGIIEGFTQYAIAY